MLKIYYVFLLIYFNNQEQRTSYHKFLLKKSKYQVHIENIELSLLLSF